MAIPAASWAQADAERLATLAREFTDPLTTLPQLFLQDAYTPENHGTDAQTNRVVGRLIVPRIPRFTLLPFVQLVRPSLFLVTVPTGKGSATRTAFGDMQLFDLFVLPWPTAESGVRVGVGPIFVFPTATNKAAGQEAWQLGPALGAVYKAIPRLLLAGLVQSPIPFAYTSSEHSVRNVVTVQPAVLLQIVGGWYVKSADATWTFGWERGAPTILPLSLGVGHVTVREGWPPINVFASSEWTAYRHNAPTAPEVTVRLGVTVAFPEWRAW
ncbi:MAG: hypothetical protein E6J72_08735 [Deltaproteobacteria bacterium]|nr:MAG: hypothetical protein E6J72_08735 [Deltaproteobacteria bacterium]